MRNIRLVAVATEQAMQEVDAHLVKAAKTDMRPRDKIESWYYWVQAVSTSTTVNRAHRMLWLRKMEKRDQSETAYARTAAAMATTRPPKEMALPAAAPTDCSGTEALEVALPSAPEEPAAAELEATGPVLLTMTAVELTPGTMGTTRDVGTMGVAVGTTAGVVTVMMLDTGSVFDYRR